MDGPRTPPGSARKPSQPPDPGPQRRPSRNLFVDDEDLASPVRNQAPKIHHEIHTTDASFEATSLKLKASHDAKTWAPPNVQAGSKYNLGAEQKEPAFAPMGRCISSHFADPLELNAIRDKAEPFDSLMAPAVCLQLTRATELWFHEMPKGVIHECMPADVGRLGRKDHVFLYYERIIVDHAKSVSRRTLDRAFQIACTIINENVMSPDFQTAMKKPQKSDKVNFIDKLITTNDIYFVYADAWKAVSFPFVFHEGGRADPEENQLRKDLKKYVRMGAAMLVYDFFRYCIQSNPGEDKDTLIERTGLGRSFVRNNYVQFNTWGPVKTISKSLARLPASPEFHITNNNHTTMEPNTLLPADEDWSAFDEQ